MSFLYLATILGSLVCMGLVDYRHRLFVFARPRLALSVVAVAFAFFLVWDLVAIEGGMYVKGDSPAMTGIDVAPHLPVEELAFITFLTYITGVFHGLFQHLVQRFEKRRDVESESDDPTDRAQVSVA